MNKQFSSTDKLVILYALLIALLAALFFSNVIVGHAMSGYVRPEGCRTYSVGITFGGVENMEAFLCGESVPVVKQGKQDNTPVTPAIVQPVQPTIDNGGETVPTVPTVPTDDNRDNCNNGAGNGDDCTPGKSSGSNQGKGQQTGDQTNQGENGKQSGGMWVTLVILAKGMHKGKRVTLWNVRHIEVDSRLTWVYFQSSEKIGDKNQKAFFFNNKDAKIVDVCKYTGKERLYTDDLDKSAFNTIAH